MKPQYPLLCFFFINLMLSSCDMIGKDHITSENQQNITLQETSWKLVSFQDEKGQKTESGSSEITLIFHGDSTLTGSSNSNTYSAMYNTDNRKVDIEKVITTEVGEPSGSKYFKFLSSLESAISYKLVDAELVISFGEKEQALILQTLIMEE